MLSYVLVGWEMLLYKYVPASQERVRYWFFLSLPQPSIRALCMHVHPRFVRQRKRTRGWISSPLPLQRMSGIHVAYYINETLCSGMCNNVIRIFASLWSFISHRNIECLISKRELMVFGLENNGPSFYYWTTAMKENAQLLASVVRWRGWF